MINDPSDALSTVPMAPSVRSLIDHQRRIIAEQAMEIRYWRDECARMQMQVEYGRMAP
ncbi:hypothetical protein PJJ30_23955 [Mycobacterium kansasii]|uniref:Uncharacterized protein n=1 Tax=Mycobacterium persicum TaxID=1487726 RepID=A0ABY6RT09_9MYCO|nr:hypothetical protein [Mycobacterium persicum]VAZ77526.1 hypothetical protein LAUMK15_03884 [Mycobacterium persicum]VBA33114.1 hypothetical protein LAUMK4_05879 [Mycobacterium persicum]